MTFTSMSEGGTRKSSASSKRTTAQQAKTKMTLAEIRVLRIEIHSADAATDKRECIIRFENFTCFRLLLMLVVLLFLFFSILYHRTACTTLEQILIIVITGV